jgi:hypothetical protein
VVAGGTNLHITAGAVPKLVNGLAVSVPPEILFVCPAPVKLALNQVTTNVSVVDPALTAAVTRTKSPE